jgi:hypothetical protein
MAFNIGSHIPLPMSVWRDDLKFAVWISGTDAPEVAATAL